MGVRGRADRGLLYHLDAGVGPAPRRASASSKSTLGGDTVPNGAARGALGPAEGKSCGNVQTGVCVLAQHTWHSAYIHTSKIKAAKICLDLEKSLFGNSNNSRGGPLLSVFPAC